MKLQSPRLALPHFSSMGLAPIDVWIRLLSSPSVHIPVRYWLRLAATLLVSLLVTLVTLPERLLVGLWLRFTRFEPKRLPGPIYVLGYDRCGTRHLHELLTCDPRLYTPRCYHALLPQGFVLTWTLLRLIMIPFSFRKRPMDSMSVNPDSPAEVELGLNNWGLASSLAGKYVLPRLYEFFDRFRTLERVEPHEYSRWQQYQMAFIRKLAFVAGRRNLLLKSPIHTSQVAHVRDLLAGVSGVKFIHISRRPEEAVAANVKLHQTLQALWGLQEPMSPENLQTLLGQELVDSQQRYLQDRQSLDAGQLVEIRYEDLLADPIGELRRAYSALGLPWNTEFEHKLVAYLQSVHSAQKNNTDQPSTSATELPSIRVHAGFEMLKREFGHNRPARQQAVLAPLPEAHRLAKRSAHIRPFAAALAVGVVCGGFSSVSLNHSLSLAGASLPLNLTWSTVFWSAMGIVSAYRLGSRPLIP